MMLNLLKNEANMTVTENGAVTNVSTMSDCLDLFATAGALRFESEEEIVNRFVRAYAEDADLAMKILFFTRDIRGGLGERRIFRVILKYLAFNETGSVLKNIDKIGEFGRYDDLLSLMDTPAEKAVIKYIEENLRKDMRALSASRAPGAGASVSLLAKWLPSVNASNRDTVRHARRICREIGMSEAEYRKALSALRAEIRIIENNLRTGDYSFEYEKQTSRSLYKYRKAFVRNDCDRYMDFINRAVSDPGILKTGTLTPYDVIAPIVNSENTGKIFSAEERKAMDATWNALEDFAGAENALAVVDGSGSMYMWNNAQPAAVAESLGIYFAEHNTGAFHGHFITFSENPALVEVKGRDIIGKVRYCMSFNECSNTNLEKTFMLLLRVAVKNKLSRSDMPEKLYVISDMEFDYCTANSELTNFENAKKMFEENGYRLPQIVFWNVCSRSTQQPVKMNDRGVALVSGCTPRIFDMLKNGITDPYSAMMEILGTKRYSCIAA